MPIGTHHTWNGVLFMKGVVGFDALLVPVAWTFIELIAKCQSSRTARSALGQCLVIILSSFGENLESPIYLYWHGMILVGSTFYERFKNSFRRFLGRAV